VRTAAAILRRTMRDPMPRSVGIVRDNFLRKVAAGTRRWTLAALSLVIVGIIGCASPPPPKVDTPVTPLASQNPPYVAPDDKARPEANGVKLLPPAMGAMQKLSGALPEFPLELRVPGRSYVVVAKICVSNAGVVERVSIVTRSESVMDTNVMLAVKDWRYRPLTDNVGATIPFCYFARFQFETRARPR
jgi:Gram-negative bacterial TonB protein C-terminal